MSTLLVVARKELQDLFRDRRTVMLGLLMMPLLFPALILGMGSLAERKARTQIEGELELPVIGAEHAPNLVAFLESQNIRPLPPPDDADASVRAQEHDAVLRIAPEFPHDWRRSRSASVELIYDSSRQDSRIPVARVRSAVEQYSRTLGVLRLMERGVSPEVTQPVRVAQRDAATPESKRGMLLGVMLPYFLIFTSFVGSAYLVIDVTAGERERQSLEPLLATPARRASIMSGKILAALGYGMLSLLMILAALKFSFAVAPGRLQVVDVTLPVLLQLLVVLLPMVLIGATLLTLISASVKSVKEAQSYMGVLMLLPIVPTILLMVNPIKNQLWQFGVPFLAQNQMILKLVRGEQTSGPEWAVYLGASFGLGLLLWLLAARLYHQERLAISA
jgi:sodium transport system permease protein